MKRNGKTVSLALGSGGARGLAHIGIIRWLEENGYVIESIAGCSMGALVGGIYAAGKLDDFAHWVCAITKADMLSLLDFSLGTDGLIKGDKIIDALKDVVGHRLIEDLPISFTAVAANISREKEVWFSDGPLFDAIRASISLPLFFTPYIHNGAKLIDGGILNPVPIAPTFGDRTDMTIAVNLYGSPEEGVEKLMKSHVEDDSAVSSLVMGFVDRFRSSIPQPKVGFKAYEIIIQSFETMQGALTRQKFAAYPPDHVLEIPKNLCRALEFDKARQLIDYGYWKAESYLPHLLKTR